MRASASALAAAPLAPLFTAAMADAAGTLRSGGADIPVYRGEFWTAKQRQATPIHEVSYRACFKPQLPAYFISRLTAPGDAVYDPFSGRGTTAIEAALHGRRIVANDINPLSAIFTRPRLAPPASRYGRGTARRNRPRHAHHRCARSLDVFPRANVARNRCAARVPAAPARGERRRRARPLDPHGCDQPAHRPLERIFLRLYPAAEPGRVGAEPVADQLDARTGRRNIATRAR